MSAADEDNLISLYQGGLSMQKVAYLAGTNRNLVLSVAKKRGIAIRGIWETRIPWTPDDMPAFLAAFDGGLSVLALARQYKIARQAIARVLRFHGRASRGRSEAERLKWSQMPEETRQRQVMAAHNSVRGVTKSDEWAHKQAVTRARLLFKAAPSEAVLSGWLAERGIESTPQVAVGRYNVDLVVGPVAVEVHNDAYLRRDGAAGDTKRIFHILDASWHVLVVRDMIFPLSAAAADYLIAWLDELRRHPSHARQYRVIDGAGHLCAAGCLDGDNLTVKWTDRRSKDLVRIYERPRQ